MEKLNINSELLFKNIQKIQVCNKLELIDEGFSSDLKYILFNCNDTYLLKLFSNEFYDKKLKEFNILNKAFENNVKSPQPFKIGYLEKFNCGYYRGK